MKTADCLKKKAGSRGAFWERHQLRRAVGSRGMGWGAPGSNAAMPAPPSAEAVQIA